MSPKNRLKSLQGLHKVSTFPFFKINYLVIKQLKKIWFTLFTF